MSARPLLTLLLAGAVSATGFAPLEWWPVALVCLAALLHFTFAASSLRVALLRGWVFGVGHFTVGNNWIQHAFDFQDKMPPVLGYFAVALLALYLAVYPAMAMGLAWRFYAAFPRHDGARRFDAAFVLAAGAAWIVTEWLRASMFTGFAWNPLGVLWVPLPIADLAKLTGTYGLSGLTIVAAGAFVLATRRKWLVPGIVGFALALAAVAGSFEELEYHRGAAPGATRVRVVQPNIGQDAVGSDPLWGVHAYERMLALSGRTGDAPRLLAWPEGMVDYYLEDGYPERFYRGAAPALVRAQIAAVLRPGDVALVGGNALFFDAPGGGLSDASNSVFALDAGGAILARYDKAHLVPYGEYLPMRGLLAPLGLARLVMGDIDFRAGPGPRTLNLPGFGAVGVQICYEIIFSGQVIDSAHRPALLFNPSNDAWFGSWGPPQHLAQARMRAIEEGLPVIRSTPTGISAVIDADGRVLGSVPLGQSGVVDVPLPRPHDPTPFARLGNWAAFLLALLLFASAVAIRRYAR